MSLSLTQYLSGLEQAQQSKSSLSERRDFIRSLGLIPNYPVVTIAGTNGKGSVARTLESLCQVNGLKVGCFTSPHVLTYSERIRVNGLPVSDEAIVSAFEWVDQNKGDLRLSYFDYSFLAALSVFDPLPALRATMPSPGSAVGVFEVGIGGRLDVVNTLDAQIAIVTNVGTDHQNVLGQGREAIGFQKAGILRPQGTLITAEKNLPLSVIAEIQNLNVKCYQWGRDFDFEVQADHWHFHSSLGSVHNLPKPKLALVNVATAFMSFQCLGLGKILPKACQDLSLPGRLQSLPGFHCSVWVDVSHNREAIEFLNEALLNEPVSGKTHIVFSALDDKPIEEMVSCFPFGYDWYLAPLSCPRAASLSRLTRALDNQPYQLYDTIGQAFEGALKQAKPEDRVIVCGSFYSVEQILRQCHD